MITLAQFLKILVNTNYMTDESDYLAEFLDVLRQSKKNEKEETDLNNDLESIELGEALELSKAELNSLFYLVGYCIYTTKKRNTHCEECISYIESKDGEDFQDFSKLIKLKDYKDGCLTRPSESIFNVVKAVEYMFRDIEKNLCGR
ncbi:hypothetical protein SNE40_021163 [Patella caerulea]|uniref:Uncharacterized protein n=1 Tax=Patella caerulea TaxID=87958 RepID=A0AAN8IWC9_PATCE